MKICFFSDVHGNNYAFDSFIEDIADKEIDLIVFGGDVLGYYYGSNEILDKLRSMKIECILGNHDNMFLEAMGGNLSFDYLIKKYGNSYKNIENKISVENIDFLKNLQNKKDIVIDNLHIGFFHGGPENYLDMRIYPDTYVENTSLFDEYNYIFLGHTHHKMIRMIGRCQVINPGSVGQQRDGKGTSYVIFDTSSRDVKFNTVIYNKNLLIEDIKFNEDNDIMKERLIEVINRKRKI